MPNPDFDDFNIDEAAAFDFEKIAAQFHRQFTAAAWAKESAEVGVIMRLAAFLLEKTKEELIEAVRPMGQDKLFELVEVLDDQEKRFSNLAKALGSLSSRLIIAGSACVVESRPAKPVEGFGPIL